MEHIAREEAKAFEVVKMALVASVRGYAPPVAVEFARKLLFTEVRPTFADLEAHLRGKGKPGAAAAPTPRPAGAAAAAAGK
jgi:flagellar motor component MotA